MFTLSLITPKMTFGAKKLAAKSRPQASNTVKLKRTKKNTQETTVTSKQANSRVKRPTQHTPSIIIVTKPDNTCYQNPAVAALFNTNQSPTSFFRDIIPQSMQVLHKQFPLGGKILFLGSSDGREAYSSALALAHAQVLEKHPDIPTKLHTNYRQALKAENTVLQAIAKRFPIRSIEQHDGLTQLARAGLFQIGQWDLDELSYQIEPRHYNLSGFLSRHITKGELKKDDWVALDDASKKAAGKFETKDAVKAVQTIKPNSHIYIGARNMIDHVMEQHGLGVVEDLIVKCKRALRPNGFFATSGELHKDVGYIIERLIHRHFTPVDNDVCTHTISESPFYDDTKPLLYQKK